MQETFGWGFIGCGDVVTRMVAPSLAGLEGHRIVAAMRRSREPLEAFAHAFGVPVATTDPSAVIDHPDTDVVYVATREDCHLEYARAVAHAGKPCVIEKPAGRSLAETRKIADLFRRAGVPLFVAWHRTYLPRFQRVKAIIDGGALGRIVSVDYRLCRPAAAESARWDASVTGGGRFFDLGGHMLHAFQDWFGPLGLSGSAVTNAIPANEVEDAASLVFRTADGAVGTAVFDFASPDRCDELVIRGERGCLRLEGLSRWAPVRLDMAGEAHVRLATEPLDRKARLVRAHLGMDEHRTWRFDRNQTSHGPFCDHVARTLLHGGDGRDELTAAVRTSELLNEVLNDYYAGRADAFWDRPATWQSLRAHAARRAAQPLEAAYTLSDEQIRKFDELGFLGPFRFDGDWRKLFVPVKKGRNLHLREADVFEACTHPSIVQRIAQLMTLYSDEPGFSFLKSRFVVKNPGIEKIVAWHQDVGDANGGYHPDGTPATMLTVWLALDPATPESGAVQVIPGTHQGLVGDYRRRIRAELVEKGDLTQAEIDRAVTMALEPGEFFIFHSWLLHGSGPNESGQRRAGLNARFTPADQEFEPDVEYFRLHAPRPAASPPMPVRAGRR